MIVSHACRIVLSSREFLGVLGVAGMMVDT